VLDSSDLVLGLLRLSIIHTRFHHKPYIITRSRSSSQNQDIMTSRRIVGGDKTILEKDDRGDFSPSASENSSIAPAVPACVLICAEFLLIGAG
jgi:hypothetical protein